MRHRFHSRRWIWLPLVLVFGCGAGGLETPADPAGALEPLNLPAADRVPEKLPAIVARVNTHTITSDELERAVRSAEIKAGQALPPQFRNLDPGDLSEVIETPFGMHVIQMVEREAERTAPFVEASVQIHEFLLQQEQQASTAAFIEELKAKSDIEILI